MNREDRYGNRLTPGTEVKDLRADGGGRIGIVMGITERGILVKWDGNEDDSLVDGTDVVINEVMFH